MLQKIFDYYFSCLFCCCCCAVEHTNFACTQWLHTMPIQIDLKTKMWIFLFFIRISSRLMDRRLIICNIKENSYGFESMDEIRARVRSIENRESQSASSILLLSRRKWLCTCAFIYYLISKFTHTFAISVRWAILISLFSSFLNTFERRTCVCWHEFNFFIDWSDELIDLFYCSFPIFFGSLRVCTHLQTHLGNIPYDICICCKWRN